MSPLSSEEIAGLGFERVIASAPLSIVVVDTSGQVIYSNERARDLTAGLGREMPTDLDQAIDIFHADGRRYERHEWPVLRSITSGEEIVDEEFFYAAPDGGPLWVRCSSSPVRDVHGEIVAAVLAQTDVSQRKREEARLAYLGPMLNHTEDAIIAFDPDWHVTAWNKGAERMYGWGTEEVLGREPRSLMRADLSDEQRAEYRREIVERGRWRGELAVARKDGLIVWIESINVAIRDEHGEITGYLAIHRDVTERKQAEKQLRDAKRRTEAILESITDSFTAVDSEWRYTYLNQRALERIQELDGKPVTLTDLVGTSMWEAFPHLVGTTTEHELRRAVREQRPVTFETYSPGTHDWLEVHAYPSKDGGLSVYGRDITERKAAEEQLERRAGQQAAVAELGLRALEHVGLRSLMDEGVALVCRTLGVEYAKLDELLPGGEGLLVRAGAGWRDGVVGNCVMPTGRGSPAGYALLAGEPLIVEDMTADTPFEVPSVLRDHGVMSDITVVIDPSGHPFGTLVAASTERRTFSEDDVSFVQSVANVLATAIERAKSEERLQSAQEAERSRIARALHDEALSSLADSLALAMAARRASPESAPSSQLVAVLRRVGQQLRGAIYDLRLENELQAPFPELLDQVVAVHRALGVDCEIELEMGPGTPTGSLGATGIEVVRIVGEALTNVRRHADARHARVRVWGADNKLGAEVSDDGRGFDPTAPRSPRHHGLTGMRERAQQVGGRLEIDSAPGVGTTVRLETILPNGSSGAS
jgi:PAS domain S-box-containing protein